MPLETLYITAANLILTRGTNGKTSPRLILFLCPSILLNQLLWQKCIRMALLEGDASVRVVLATTQFEPTDKPLSLAKSYYPIRRRTLSLR